MTDPIIDHDTLVLAVADWLNRADLETQIPVFVTLAEAQFNRDLRVLDMMVRAFTTSQQENVTLPADWLEHYSLTILPGGTQTKPLRYMAEKESNEIKAANYGQAGDPVGYTLIGRMIEIVPKPAGDLNLRMVYYQRIPSLAIGANWLVAKSPDLYLYCTLMQAEPYLKNDERLQVWATVRGALMDNIRAESEQAMRPRSGLTARAAAF